MFTNKLHRRSFLKSIPSFAIPALLPQLVRFDEIITHYPLIDNDLSDSEFWDSIRNDFFHSDGFINLNSGGLSPQPKIVQELHKEFLHFSNQLPTYNMWRILEKERENIRTSLANLAGCSAEEIAINRNATEALDTIILGIKLKKGDEIVMSKFDYPRMMAQLRRRQKEEGVVLKYANLKVPMEDEEQIVDAYTSLFSKKTKVILLTHVINWTGQVIPVAKIAAKAKENGILVIVDGAHSFANLEYRIDELNCDFFGASLHKWLCAPFGTGLLYVNRDKIASLPPIFYSDALADNNIRKFEELGTRNNAAEMCINKAIEYHNNITTKRKGERLIFLRNYWAEKLSNKENVKILHPKSHSLSCGLGLLEVEGKTGVEVYDLLLKSKIITTPIVHEGVSGVRISPNIFTSTQELDYFVEQVIRIAQN
jgi:selenocysteine lyase/cysteine desulfurase